MAIAQAVANSFKKEILEGIHDLETGGDTFKLALYEDTANLSAATTAYPGDSTGDQVGDTGQYVQGGGVLTGQETSLDTGVAIVNFADLSFTGVTINCKRSIDLYIPQTTNNAAVAVLDFGGNKTATAGTFTIQFPAFTIRQQQY
jgi:hypothetical protein